MLVKKTMKNRLFVFALSMFLLSAFVFTSVTPKVFAMDKRTVIDMAGRPVSVNATISKVYGTSPNATIYLYTLAPEKLAGCNYAFNEAEKKFVPSKYQSLPILGNFSGSKTSTNLEALIKANPDVLIMTSDSLGTVDAEDADKLQKQTGIPVFMIDGKLKSTSKAYLALGNLMNLPSQAKKLATYCDMVTKEVNSHKIPASKKVTVFFGNGAKSLDTAPSGSASSEVFEMVGATNVAVLPGVTTRIEVGLEQVIKWNPSMMFINGEPKQGLSATQAIKALQADKAWSIISAVKNGKTYAIPKAPYAWIDRPPGPNRIIGLLWVGKTIYPDYYKKVNMNTEVKKFYNLFYHVSLSDGQVKELLNK